MDKKNPFVIVGNEEIRIVAFEAVPLGTQDIVLEARGSADSFGVRGWHPQIGVVPELLALVAETLGYERIGGGVGHAVQVGGQTMYPLVRGWRKRQAAEG